jgi:hypothetical protein
MITITDGAKVLEQLCGTRITIYNRKFHDLPDSLQSLKNQHTAEEHSDLLP